MPISRNAAGRLLRGAFWAALVFAFVMALLPQPPALPGAPSDKLQHILAFAVLTALACAAYPRTRPAVVALGLAAAGAAIELLQAIPALHRDSSLSDWLADVAAILAALAVMALVRRLRQGRSG